MIADRIRFLRNRQGLSQAKLARSLRVTRSSVNAWELGISTPSTSTIIALAQIFHVSTDYLLELDDSYEDKIDLKNFSSEERALIFHLINYINRNKAQQPANTTFRDDT